MRCLRLGEVVPGMILARAARTFDGGVLARPGLALSGELLARLRQQGLHELWVVPPGSAVPDPAVPEYLDRYGPDFAARLQGVFGAAMVNRTMQNLFLCALAHASDCYRRYRLSDREE